MAIILVILPAIPGLSSVNLKNVENLLKPNPIRAVIPLKAVKEVLSAE